MGIISELSSATGARESNAEVARRCLGMPVLLHSVAEGLRTGTPQTRADCLQVLALVAQRRPDLLVEFASELFETIRRGPAKITKEALSLLEQIVPSNPSSVFAERDYLIKLAQGGGPRGLAAAKVVAALCASGTNYRGKLLLHTLRLLSAVPDKDLPRWVAALSPAVAGSADGIKRFSQLLEPRTATIESALAKRVDRMILKLNRSLGKRR